MPAGSRCVGARRRRKIDPGERGARGCMKAIIVGGGIGGLTTALMLHARGSDCEVFEQAETGALIGADGIHSLVREKLYPHEGPARWNGIMLWRGAIDWPVFLTGRSMIVAGGMAAKLVIYPIAEGSRADRRLTNWAVAAKIGDG